MTRTRRVGQLEDAVSIIRARLLASVATGTADRSRTRVRVDVAADHAADWAGSDAPREGDRGGSRSPVEEEERVESARVKRQATRDQQRIALLARKIQRDTLELARLVDRYVETVDASKLPQPRLAGCRSCARAGHFAPVREDVPGHALCGWCYGHALDEAHERGAEQITSAHWPPIKACDLYHAQSARAAGVWLAKHKGTAA